MLSNHFSRYVIVNWFSTWCEYTVSSLVTNNFSHFFKNHILHEDKDWCHFKCVSANSERNIVLISYRYLT